MKAIALILVLLTVACIACGPPPEVKLPEPTGFISDYAGKLSASDKEAIEKKLRAINFWKSDSNVEIGVAIIPTLDGLDISDYAVRLGKKWGIGKKDKDNGVLFVIAVQERKTFIATGYGIEPKIPDMIAQQICQNVARPFLAKGDYNGGINAVIDAVVQKANK